MKLKRLRGATATTLLAIGCAATAAEADRALLSAAQATQPAVIE